jgi:hypothetical protein
MTDSTLARIRAALPLKIRGIEVNDPALTLYGEDWSLNLSCPWRIVGSEWSVSWESDDIEDTCWDLVGHSIVSVTSEDGAAMDPVFGVDTDITVSVFADTDLDPWVLRLPDLVIVGQTASG